jgi:hypothetical protein
MPNIPSYSTIVVLPTNEITPITNYCKIDIFARLGEKTVIKYSPSSYFFYFPINLESISYLFQFVSLKISGYSDGFPIITVDMDGYMLLYIEKDLYSYCGLSGEKVKNNESYFCLF